MFVCVRRYLENHPGRLKRKLAKGVAGFAEDQIDVFFAGFAKIIAFFAVKGLYSKFLFSIVSATNISWVIEFENVALSARCRFLQLGGDFFGESVVGCGKVVEQL